MTKSEATRRCAYCRRPVPVRAPGGRPGLYCRRSHRQRAYEARRRAARAALPPGHVVVAQVDLDRLHDVVYALEAALEDVEGDLAGVRPEGRAAAARYAAALEHLREAAGDLAGVVVEPVIR